MCEILKNKSLFYKAIKNIIKYRKRLRNLKKLEYFNNDDPYRIVIQTTKASINGIELYNMLYGLDMYVKCTLIHIYSCYINHI